ncbi:hypothetical protein CN692_04875 [Bacillus sp. AFS002410]|nr:hypothetical protein CN692_04875 [Bacillus sp. AFS002410]
MKGFIGELAILSIMSMELSCFLSLNILYFNAEKYPEVVYAQNSALYERNLLIYAQKPPFYEPSSQNVRDINNMLAVFQRTAATQKESKSYINKNHHYINKNQ